MKSKNIFLKRRRCWSIFFFYFLILSSTLFSQRVTDPLPYAPIANPLPDTMDQLYRDSINLKFSPIRVNQAGYRPQDKKFFYYVDYGNTRVSSFVVIDNKKTVLGSGTLRSTGLSTSGQLKIKASNNAQLVHNGDTRYTMESRLYSGPLYEGVIPDLPVGSYRIVVGKDTSAEFVIHPKVYSWVKNALLKFYGVNRCGDSKSWFHPPCHLKDPVTGGWHDCGDHLKEAATMGYTASVLGLAAAVFPSRDEDVYDADQSKTLITDGIPDILYEAKHGADFILQSYDKAGGQVGKMITCVGNFGEDHMWWGRPEYQDNMPKGRGGPPRDARNLVGANYLGNYAANLAFVSKRYRPYNPAYADKCLKAAKDLYEYAKRNQEASNTEAYNGSGTVNDDIAFACLALLWATEERKYLDELCFDKNIGVKANSTAFPKALFDGGWFAAVDPLFSHATANTDWGSVHSHVLWGFFRLILDDVKLCEKLGLTEKQRLALIEKTVYHLISNLSAVGLGNQSIELPPTGVWAGNTIRYQLPWFTMHTQQEWVWNRYQAGNITEMFYYYDVASRIQGLELPNTPASTNWKAEEVKTILVRMLDYMLGVNPWDISMIYGVGEKNFNHPHHRAANPEGKNVPGAFYRYTPPVGALQGGYAPTTTVYDEFWADYHHSETGIDGTTNIFMPVLGLAKDDTLGPPTANVKILYVGCDQAIIEIRQSRYGTSMVRYGTGLVPDKVKKSDSTGVLHRITLSGLSQGTEYIFDVVVTDLFGRESIIKNIDEEKKEVYFTFTTLQNCLTNAEITNVKVCKVTHDSAEIFWYTPNGEFNSRVVYGTQKPPSIVHDGDVAGHPVKFHYVKIGGLKEQTTYYFYVESGNSRDDNNGQLYQFTTPVEHVAFDIRSIRYTWQSMPALGLNIVNQDKKSYDSLDIRIYFRAKEGFEKDLGARMDIGIVYKEDGYQEEFTKNTEIRQHIMRSRPVKMEDTYDPRDQTYAYYLSIPLWGVTMKSGSRIRLDIIFDRRSPWPPYEDLMNEPPQHVISDRDWSFGPHSRANGDPVDFPGVPVLPKESVDDSYWTQPINYYITVYRKGEYVWGYSPSMEETKRKKNYYTIVSQVTAPLNNPSADYVFLEGQARTVNVSGWATVSPEDGTLNEIWVNGVKQNNIQSLVKWNEKDKRYDFTIPVPVRNGRNNVDITLFAGPPLSCVDCYGCAVSNHSFYIEYIGAKQYPSMLVLRDQNMQPLGDTVKLDTTLFHIVVTDRNGNTKGKSKDIVTVFVKNLDNGDSIAVTLIETGDSTGVFQTENPIAVVDRQPQETQGLQIAMNGGDRVRVWYIDPTDETDSSEAFIYSRANFPVARRGYLKDTNGDGAVDLLVVEYSLALKENIDSVKINFPNASTIRTVKKGVDNISYQGNIVSVVFSQPLENGITGFSSATYTKGKSFLTYNSSVKISEFPVYDSAGPVLIKEAYVNEREGEGRDTVTITLSEAVELSSFSGEAILLLREGKAYPINVIAVLSNDPIKNQMSIICDLKGMKFISGDSLKLNSEGNLRDFSGNKPHSQNRAVPVMIKKAPPKIIYAYYLDTDFNGKIDGVKMGFNKQVNIEQLDIRLQWNRGSFVSIDKAAITFIENSTSEIFIKIDSKVRGEEIATSGEMIGAVALRGLSADTSYAQVVDSAAPVIYAAKFFLSTTISENGKAVDTLRVIFSEPVTIESMKNITAFNLLRPHEGIYYTFNINSSQVVSQKEFIFIGTSTGVDYPQSGDSIWLQPEARLSDFKGNMQISEKNRRVMVTVGDIAFSIKNIVKKVYPNPFNPFTNESVVIRLTPDKSRFPVKIDTLVRVVIYDKVGNVVAKLNSKPLPDGAEIKWNGTNRNGRIVGDGTYLCYLYFKGEKEKLFIGVRKR